MSTTRFRFPRAAFLWATLLAIGCERASPPGADDLPPGSGSADPTAEQTGVPVLPPELSPTAVPSTVAEADLPEDPAPADEPPPPWPGPFLAITRSSVGVYAEPAADRNKKIGYVQSGARVPVHDGPIEKSNCPAGWYRTVAGGYICGEAGSTNPKAPEARFGRRQPALDEILPYTYARNAKNGTPLYKSVPTPEQMHRYEPYLAESRKGERPQPVPAEKETPGAQAAMVAHVADGGAAPSPAPKKAWWQSENIDERLHEVSLADLSAEADDLIAKRMVKGFYVAVDKQFSWNGRPWYKTTAGLIAPADRFWTTKGSEFQGVELGDSIKLPVGWTYGWRKTRPKYRLDADGKTLKPAGDLGRFALVPLTGEERKIGGKTYVEGADGTWVQRDSLRITRPGPPPADLAPKERWVDINLDTQTLVVFEGTRPLYATLISSGKEHRDKAKDHRTPTGEWRIREKHVTGTMDGDGTAAGDLPYSIEDVPYVMYFYRAYALHGAFWHQNYGSQMSHGCVNLAPLDAKWVFFHTDPPVPEGWHGAWSSEERPGSRVVVHE
jgi:hypothetical protein